MPSGALAYLLVHAPWLGEWSWTWRALQRNETTWLRSRTVYVERLPQVQAPTLILHGAGDTLVPVAWAERAQRLIPRARLVVMPGAKHWLPRERPQELDRLVGEFLADSQLAEPPSA